MQDFAHSRQSLLIGDQAYRFGTNLSDLFIPGWASMCSELNTFLLSGSGTYGRTVLEAMS